MRWSLHLAFIALALTLIVVWLQRPSSTPTPVVVVDPAAPELFRDDPREALALLAEPSLVNLDGMIENRTIRALVVHSKTFYFLDGAVQRGLSYDALRQFETFINTKFKRGTLKINIVFLPVSRDKLIPALLAGVGDIAVANLTITADRRQQVDFSKPSISNVAEVLVTPAGAAVAARTLSELSGSRIHVRRSSSYYQSLLALNRDLQNQSLPLIDIVPADENLEDEDLLEMVNAGLIPATVVDSHKAVFWGRTFDNIKVHSHLALRQGASIGWAFRKGSPKLKSAVNEFMQQHRAGTLHGNILLRRYLQNTAYIENALSSQELQKFKDSAHFFQQYAARYDFDWLMIVAQAYQESRLIHSARSASGAIGIMQIKPDTAADKNVAIDDIEELENNIHAGVKYLRFIRDRYFSNESMSALNKTLFAFAAYNAGPGRVARLRREADAQGLDPNLWFDNVEVIAARRIGRETVRYVSNIFKYWVAYSRSQEQLNAAISQTPGPRQP